MALTATPPPPDVPDVDAGVIEEARARQRRHRGVAIAAAVAAVAILVAIALNAGGGAAGSGVGSATPGEPVELVPGQGVSSVHLPSGAGDLATGDGAVWVSGFRAVTRLDAATGRVVARISTPAVGDNGHIAVGDGSVWATAGLAPGGRGILYRIDPQTNRVIATIRVGDSPVFGVAVGAGRVWVTVPKNGPGEVVEINPATNRVTGSPIKVGPGPIGVSYGQHAVWVENTSPPSAVRIDPVTRTVSSAPVVEALGEPAQGDLIAGYGSLWEAANDSLTRFDPRTGNVLASDHIFRAQATAIGAGAVWVLVAPRASSPNPTLSHAIKRTAALWELGPRDNRIVGTPLRLDAVSPSAITVTANDVWVADNGQTVTRIPLIRCRATRCAQQN